MVSKAIWVKFTRDLISEHTTGLTSHVLPQTFQTLLHKQSLGPPNLLCQSRERLNELHHRVFSATLDCMDQNAYHTSPNAWHGSTDFFELVKGELYEVLSRARSGGNFSVNRQK